MGSSFARAALSFVIVTLASEARPARAQTPAYDFEDRMARVTTSGAASRMVGWEFTANVPIVVSHLGYFDAGNAGNPTAPPDGLFRSYPMGVRCWWACGAGAASESRVPFHAASAHLIRHRGDIADRIPIFPNRPCLRKLSAPYRAAGAGAGHVGPWGNRVVRKVEKNVPGPLSRRAVRRGRCAGVVHVQRPR